MVTCIQKLNFFDSNRIHFAFIPDPDSDPDIDPDLLVSTYK